MRKISTGYSGMKKTILALLITSLFISTALHAESCEKKWAKYYAGKSWFEPWCDTESYKARVAENSYYDDDDERKPTRYEKNQMRVNRVSFSNPTYRIAISCNSDLRSKEHTKNSCIDLFGDITFTSPENNDATSVNADQINTVVLRCNIILTTTNNKITTISRLYEASTGNVFSKYIQENETRNLPLYETEFYKHWKRQDTRTRLVNGRSYSINVEGEAEIVNSVECKPIYVN